MKKISLTILPLLILTACATEPVTVYRWHRTGASKAEVSRQIDTCKSQARNETRHGNTSRTFEQCMDEAGYYSYEHGSFQILIGRLSQCRGRLKNDGCPDGLRYEWKEQKDMVTRWFPGHMNKAKKAIAERIKSVNMVIEMLDAHTSASSESPLLAQLPEGKPRLKILNKQDLTGPERTKAWLEHYNSHQGTRAIVLGSSKTGAHGKIIQACRAMIPHRQGIGKPLRVLIHGIPSVGKSTLTNGTIGKKSAKIGNEPSITKAEQRLFLTDDFWLYDTPGMLWPKVIAEKGGYSLTASDAVGRNALDEEEVVLELLDYLHRHYPALLQECCQANKSPSSHWDDTSWLEWTTKKRGAVLSGERINYQKTTGNILVDFYEGKIGRIMLETPNQWEAWLKKAKQEEAELKAIHEARKAERKGQQPSAD